MYTTHASLKTSSLLTHDLSLFLKPQLIWRGSDVTYLLELRKPSLFKPFASAHVDSHKDEKTRRVDAVQSLMGKIDTLVPRWKVSSSV